MRKQLENEQKLLQIGYLVQEGSNAKINRTVFW